MIRATAILASLLLSSTAQAEGNVNGGAVVFKKCVACHNLDEQVNKVGPHLVGIVGRKAGSILDFSNYSDAMKQAGSGGLMWDEKSLSEYLASPKKFLPGNRMSFTGLKSPNDISLLIKYLVSTNP